MHRHGRWRVEDEEIGCARGGVQVEGGKRDTVRGSGAVGSHINVWVEAVDENTKTARDRRTVPCTKLAEPATATK